MDKPIARLDASMVGRITTGNPQSFTLSNGVIWNSWISLLDRTGHFEPPHSRELAGALVMAPNFAGVG
jgi:hypothetical protein